MNKHSIQDPQKVTLVIVWFLHVYITPTICIDQDLLAAGSVVTRRYSTVCHSSFMTKGVETQASYWNQYNIHPTILTFTAQAFISYLSNEPAFRQIYPMNCNISDICAVIPKVGVECWQGKHQKGLRFLEVLWLCLIVLLSSTLKNWMHA